MKEEIIKRILDVLETAELEETLEVIEEFSKEYIKQNEQILRELSEVS